MGALVSNGADTAGCQTQEAITLASLLARRQVWQWRVAPQPVAGIATGIRALDAVLPMGGWPATALSELLVPVWGLTELQLLWPVLARLSRAGGRVVLVAPPFVPFAGAWQRAGVDLSRLTVIGAAGATGAADALWAFEQCLRSGSCAAVVGWPAGADHAALRRLQVAADHGQCLALAMRPARHAAQPSPAALRLQLRPDGCVQVLKCRGGPVPAQPVALAAHERTLPWGGFSSGHGVACGQHVAENDAATATATADAVSSPRVILIAITKGGAEQAARLAAQLPQATLCTSQKFAAAFDSLPNEKRIYTGGVKEQMGEIFRQYDQLVCFVSVGAIIRLAAPLLQGKETDPGVIAVDDAARFVVPLLSGHVGGANAWAEQVARLLGATPVLTTASDARGSLAVDILGRTLGWQVEAPKINLIRVAAAVVNEEPIALVQEAGSRHWWTRSTPLPRHIEVLNDMTEVRPGHHRALLLITHRLLDEDLWRQWPEHLIVYRPPAGQGADERPTPAMAGSTTAP